MRIGQLVRSSITPEQIGSSHRLVSPPPQGQTSLTWQTSCQARTYKTRRIPYLLATAMVPQYNTLARNGESAAWLLASGVASRQTQSNSTRRILPTCQLSRRHRDTKRKGLDQLQ